MQIVKTILKIVLTILKIVLIILKIVLTIWGNCQDDLGKPRGGVVSPGVRR